MVVDPFSAFLQRRLERAASAYLAPPAGVAVAFDAPEGAPALFAADSVSWRVMANPVALIIGGIAAVILELAEPRVRSGVWDHTSFRRDPVTRIKRTGFAAMVTAFAPADAARAMIERVNAAHARIVGVTPEGRAYRADDPELLRWVQATAAWGFLTAYHRFVRELTPVERDRYYAEAAPVAALYGAVDAPTQERGVTALFTEMAPLLERSDIVFAFLRILGDAPLLPSRALQRLMIRAAVDVTPPDVRATLGLGPQFGLKAGQGLVLKAMGAAGEAIVLRNAPAALARVRVSAAPQKIL